jgi:hypothetical protein
MPRSTRAIQHLIAATILLSLLRGSRFSLGVLLAALLLAGALLPSASTLAQEATPAALSQSPAESPLAAASAWLRAQQDPSGGFAGLSGEVDPGVTIDAVMALYAAKESDPDAAGALAAAVAYLEGDDTGYERSGTGQAAKLALAAIAGGKDPHDFGGVDLLQAIQAPPTTSVQNPIPGIYGDDLYDHALALIAFTAAGEAVPDDALEPFRATQGGDGGWAFDGSTESGAADSNTTALVIQALAASGLGDDPMVGRGLDYLRTLLAPDGSGFAYGPADPLVADANSTALAVQALIAAGQDPASPEWGNAAAALAAFQAPDGGVRYMLSDEEPNLLATLQAIPALAGMPLPVATACATGATPEVDGCVPLAPAA